MSKGFQKTAAQTPTGKSQTDVLMEGLVQNSYAIQHLQGQVDMLFGLVRMRDIETAVVGSQVVLDANVFDSEGKKIEDATLVTFTVDTRNPQNYPAGMVDSLLGCKAYERRELVSTMPENHPAFPGQTLKFEMTIVKVLF